MLNLKTVAAFLCLFLSISAYAEDKLIVFAAASLTNALSEIDSQFEKEHGLKVSHSFASSATLAKQIENGAPADVFISADIKWMNYLQDKSSINKATRKNLLGNKLVLIAPKGRTFEIKFDKAFDFSKTFDGRLCTGDMQSVPVGIYAKEALTNLGWWQNIKSRIVGTQDVRAALAFVERGECSAGIVYETDAKVSAKVDVVGVFPELSHAPVVYPIAATNQKNSLTNAYLNNLESNGAKAIFRKYGFNTEINAK